MKLRPFDPLRLDVERFAAVGGHLDGQWQLESFGRLQALPANPPCAVTWQVDAEQRFAVGLPQPEIALRLRARAAVTLTCQRCLAPVELPVEIDRRVRFARDEAEAEALDAELEDDVLALPRALNLQALLEDELILALPLVPRHDSCPSDAPAPPATGSTVEASERPFAVLVALKRNAVGE